PRSPFSPVMSELAILRHEPIMAHPNIIECLGVTWDIEQVTEPSIWPVLVLEYSECGSLAEFNKSLPFDTKIRICIDIGSALQCLHSCGVAHCDIKSENVLVFVEYDDAGSMMLSSKLTDFGCA